MRQKCAVFFLSVAQGALIGAAGIVPGASGGVLAVSMGIYRPIVDAVLTLFKNFKKNFLYLLPFGDVYKRQGEAGPFPGGSGL